MTPAYTRIGGKPSPTSETPLPGKSLESHNTSQSSGQQCTTHGDRLQTSVQHLAPVASAAALEEIGHVVAAGKRSIRNLFPEELAQRAVAIANLVLEQALWGHQAADLLNVVQVHLLALVGEVPAEEGLEELAQHGVVHASSPAEVGNKAVFPVRDTPPDSFHDGSKGLISKFVLFIRIKIVNIRMPRVHITGRQNNLSIRVGLNELLCKSASRPVADGLNRE